MADLKISLMGSPEIRLDGNRATIKRTKAIALLSYLVVQGETQQRDTLATLFWPKLGQTQARANLRYTLWSLRNELGTAWFDADREQIAPSSALLLTVDLNIFRHAAARRRAHRHAEETLCSTCQTDLESALALYRGTFMEGFTLQACPEFDAWQHLQAQSLHNELAEILNALVAHYRLAAQLDLAIHYAQRLVAVDPLHEASHRLLMDLYANSGQRAAAIRQFQECQRILQLELGMTPDNLTLTLLDGIQAGQVGQEAPRSAVESARFPQHNLPLQPTPLVGHGERARPANKDVGRRRG